MGKRIEFSKSDLAYIVNAIDILGITYKELGKEFGCSRTTIWRRYKEAKAELAETELSRLSDKRKKEYEEREKYFIQAEAKEQSLRERQDEAIGKVIEEQKYKQKYEEQQSFIKKIKGWFKYILTGGDSTQW